MWCTGTPRFANVFSDVRVERQLGATEKSALVLVRVASLNNVPSQVRTIVVPEVPIARPWDVPRFWAVLINFGRFQRRYAPKHTPRCTTASRSGASS